MLALKVLFCVCLPSCLSNGYFMYFHSSLIFFKRRENEQLSSYGDAKTGRAIMLAELKKVIEANPIFHDKLEFPNFKKSRLRTLINQR